MIKRPVFLALLICASVLISLPSQAATSVRGTASAQVVDKISVRARTPLIFGYILPGSKAGTVTVSPNNRRSSTGNIKLVPGAYERAMFLIKGTPNRTYSIHTPQTLTVKAIGMGAFFSKGKVKELQAQNFVAYSNTAGTLGSTGRLGHAGFDMVYLGATLIVPDNAAPGLYTSNVPLTVSY